MTFLFETIKLGVQNLRLHLLRSILTTSGIVFGIAAVIVMVSIGEGSTRQALLMIESLGATNIIVRSQKPPQSGQQQGGQQSGFVQQFGITRADLAVIREHFREGVEAIVPVKAVGNQLLKDDRVQTSQAFGTIPQLRDVANLRVARGRYLSQEDLDRRALVAVIGSEVARILFPFDDPLGDTIRIDEAALTVVGVLEPVGLSGGAGALLIGRDLNLDVHIPLTTAEAKFGDVVIRRQSGSTDAQEVQVSEVYVKVADREQVLIDAARLRRLMDVRHPGLTDIELIVPFELLQAAKNRARTGRVVSAAIAGVSLLVGGIGIMNIMLASVTERTREIGIRRALGATRKHIIWQFLIETSVLSSIGGVIGVGLGIGVSVAMEKGIADLPTVITGWSIVVALVVATLTGLIAGMYPARKAAMQDPIVALRHD
ncbi:MAG: ABC transporter permease [Planctomycetes bacterium]|nr:ABC transporter permease [Planctomycetota bacterium]